FDTVRRANTAIDAGDASAASLAAAVHEMCGAVGLVLGSMVLCEPDQPNKPNPFAPGFAPSFAPNFSSNSSAAMANPWSVIRARGRLVVGVNPKSPPLSRQDANGQWSGFEIDLGRQLAADLLGSPDKVEFVPLTPRQRINTLQSGAVDLVISQMTITTNRTRLVDFSLGYYIDGTVLVHGSRITPVRQRIGILKGSDNIAIVQQQFPEAAIVGLNTYAQGWSALQANQIDYLAGDYSGLLPWLQQNPTVSYTLINKPLSRRSWGIALPRGLQHEDTRKKVFQSIQTWRSNGWLDRQAKQWGVTLPPAP
ncbi:MAG: transporter substrate-binding domain-containing protein, partial [Pseudanabaenaceae cyanobacterium]